jgi:hypothetical protein
MKNARCSAITERREVMGDVPTVLKGVVHGRMIELDDDPGFPDGHPVTLTVEPAPKGEATIPSPLDALKRAAGSWADDVEGLDRFLEWNRRQRKINRREMPQ